VENYLSSFSLLFIAYNCFVGLLNTVAYNAIRSSPIHLSGVEIKLFHQNNFLGSATPALALALRINAIAFLIYLGFEITWYFPIILYLMSLIVLIAISAILRSTVGTLKPALLGYVLGPLLGVAMWLNV
jgi:hypothetical protein